MIKRMLLACCAIASRDGWMHCNCGYFEVVTLSKACESPGTSWMTTFRIPSPPVLALAARGHTLISVQSCQTCPTRDTGSGTSKVRIKMASNPPAVIRQLGTLRETSAHHPVRRLQSHPRELHKHQEVVFARMAQSGHRMQLSFHEAGSESTRVFSIACDWQHSLPLYPSAG